MPFYNKKNLKTNRDTFPSDTVLWDVTKKPLI